MAKKTPSAIRRQNMRYACRVFSTREEERALLGDVRSISYLRMADLEAFYDLVMRR